MACRTKWNLMSMCLVREWSIGFVAMGLLGCHSKLWFGVGNRWCQWLVAWSQSDRKSFRWERRILIQLWTVRRSFVYGLAMIWGSGLRKWCIRISIACPSRFHDQHRRNQLVQIYLGLVPESGGKRIGFVRVRVSWNPWAGIVADAESWSLDR